MQSEICKKYMAGLYKKENLVFLTEATDRRPALHFTHGKVIGSIRQKHKGGTTLSLYINNRFRIFFHGTNAREKLERTTKNLPGLAKTDSDISIDLQEGWQVLEYSTKNEQPDGEVKANRHFSEGIVRTNDLQEITPERINQMIANTDNQGCHHASGTEGPAYDIDSLSDAAIKIPTAAGSDNLPVKVSTEALLEVFSYAQQVLSTLQNMHANRLQHGTAHGLNELELLRRENELLKKELSKLDRMIKEKL